MIEGLLAFVVALTPLMLYFYKYIPSTSKDTWEILWVTFTNNGYKDVPTAFYFYLGKLVPLTFLVVWFVTCKQWWYHAILIPIAMYSFQSYSVLSEDVKKIDENEMLYLLMVCMVVIPIVYFIRVKLVDKYVHGIDLEAMEAELDSLRNKQKKEQALKESEDTDASFDKKPRYRTLSEKIEYGLSTQNIERKLKKIQHGVKNLLHF